MEPDDQANDGLQVILDKEVEIAEHDEFGHKHYAEALRYLIESPSNVPPFSIGLLGKWGTGKSTIKSIYLHDLKEDETRTSRDMPRRDRIHAITFNAWRFGGENIKRALIRHVFLKLGGDQDTLKNVLFSAKQRTENEARNWKEIRQEFYSNWAWSCATVLVVWLLVAGGLWFAAWLIGKSYPEANVASLVVLCFLAGACIKWLLDPNRFFVKRYTPISHTDQAANSVEQFEDVLIQQLEKFKFGQTKIKCGKTCERLVIFVDDLDRLSAEEMVSGLDAVRAFMELDRAELPNGLGVVFVISCDEDRIAEALASRKATVVAELPAGIHDLGDARHYLDRIFQFRLEIAPPPRQDMRSFVEQRMKSRLVALVNDVESCGVPIQDLIDRMIHVDVQSPRNALQILNTFAQSWWLARKREKDGADASVHGGLYEGAVTRFPVTLACLAALRVDHPEFYHDLLAEPDLIRRFYEVYVDGMPIHDQPEAIRIVLEKYAMRSKEQPPRTTLIYLDKKYRALRQYLANIRDHRWPQFVAAIASVARPDNSSSR